MNLDVIDVNSFVTNQTTWKDLTGKNYGRLIRDSAFCNVKDSSSLFFNGIDSSLFIGDVSLVSGNTQTISFWLKKHFGVSYNAMDIFNAYNFSANGWKICLNNSNIIKFQTLINSVIYEVSGQQIQNGIWYNVAISFNSNGFLKGYLNGVLVGAVSIPAFTIAPYYIAISNFSAYIANVLFYNRVLSDLEVLQNYNVFAKRFVVSAVPSLITSGLVMNLDASNQSSYNTTSGQIYWFDLSGYNNHGTLNFATYRRQSEGNFEFSYESDSYYVSVANSASLNATTQTISVWYYMTVNATNETLIAKHNTADESNGYKIFGSGSVQMKVSTTTTNAGLNLVPINDWHLLTVTFSANSLMRTYVNGVASGSAVVIGNLVLSTNAIRIGRTPHISTHSLTGHIAQVTIYNRVLSAAEILQNFNATKAKFGY